MMERMMSVQNKWLTTAGLIPKGCKSAFHKLLSFFSWRYSPSEHCGLRVARFELHYEKLDEDVHQSLNNHMQLLHWLGYQVQEEPLTEEISPECIGRLTCSNAGKLEYQDLLLKQEVHSVKTIVSSKRPARPVQPASGTGLHNDLNP